MTTRSKLANSPVSTACSLGAVLISGIAISSAAQALPVSLTASPGSRQVSGVVSTVNNSPSVAAIALATQQRGAPATFARLTSSQSALSRSQLPRLAAIPETTKADSTSFEATSVRGDQPTASQATVLSDATVLLAPSSSSSPFAGELALSSIASSPASATTATYEVVPRLGIRYNSANTGHEYGYVGFEGFAPIVQVPRESITFLEGRVLVHNNGAAGTNLLIGQRFYSPSGDRTYGGYIAYDTRNTGRSFFNQIGLGFETLGDWDARLNVYIPVGNTRNRVGDSISNTFTIIPSATGIGVNLLLDRRREFEAAATAADLELGGKILALGDEGVLRGYGGLYYFSPSGSPSVVGVKGRLEAIPTDQLTLGLSLQYDSLFQTRLAAMIGYTFPGSPYTNSPNQRTLPKLRGIDRLGESVARQHAIQVISQRESSQFLATSRVTGNPLRILLVNQTGGAGGNGTETTPFTTTSVAVGNAAAGDYVFALANTGAPASTGFTIPDQVTVISTRSQVPIDAVEISNIQLNPPFTRGAGILVPITGTVVMGNSTVLSGFDVNVAATPGTSGIQATGVSNILVSDNAITSQGAPGINAATLAGTANILNNRITATNERGILINGSSATLNIASNALTTTNGAAIRMDNTTGNTTVSSNSAIVNGAPGFNFQNVTGNVAVTNNAVISSGVLNDGILVNNTTGDVNLTIAQNVATGGNNGIAVQLDNAATGTVAITGNQAISSPSAGIYVRVNTLNSTPERRVTIANNTVQGNGFGPSFAPGIQIEAQGNAQLRTVIDSNIVMGNLGDGGGVGLFTIGSGNATLYSLLRFNKIMNNSSVVFGDFIANIPLAVNNHKICLRFNEGNIIGDYRLIDNDTVLPPSIIQVEPLGLGNIIGPPITIAGSVALAPSGTCGDF
ncbi:MAG: right-handed parallel beta-helix repeat-containing protein [Cyanobacteria bacterium]|nr:right-handed parallel beta-helix repeat-containing protein [Cyanobacteriota bacterium]MDW8200920.1 right-handed parallel beta-helix repeat-containing protein [Cyanobacteriota bacterium SKYGB_h_bin112]